VEQDPSEDLDGDGSFEDKGDSDVDLALTFLCSMLSDDGQHQTHIYRSLCIRTQLKNREPTEEWENM